MYVVIHVGGQVKVDDVRDVGNVEATRGDVGGDEDGRVAGPERLERPLALLLRPVAVDRRGGEPLLGEPVLELVRAALGLGEHQREALHGVHQVQQHVALVRVPLHVLDGLRDVRVRRTHSPDGDEDVVVEEIGSHALNLFGERRGEEHRLAVARLGHAALLDNLTNLGFESHVQHSIRLVQREVRDSLQGNLSPVHQVDESPWGGDEYVASPLHLAELLRGGRASVHDARRDTRLVGEFARLLVDLNGELAGRGEHERDGERLASTPWCLEPAVDDAVDDGEAERGRLTRTGLRASHQIAALERDWNGVFLNRGGRLELAPLDVAVDGGAPVDVREELDGLRAVLPRRLHRDVLVRVKVDAGRFAVGRRVRVISGLVDGDGTRRAHPLIRTAVLLLLLRERVLLAVVASGGPAAAAAAAASISSSVVAAAAPAAAARAASVVVAASAAAERAAVVPGTACAHGRRMGGRKGTGGQHRIEVCIDGCVEDVRLEDGEKSCSFSQPNKHGNAKLLSEFRVSDESDARKLARDARRDACMRPCARAPDGRPIGGPSTGASRRDRGRYRAMTWATRVAPRVGERHRVFVWLWVSGELEKRHPPI